jgi:drug/metabolite transporter (DMT)-like permease
MTVVNVQRYALVALAAAALFGVSAPLTKLLAAGIHPVLLAGLLYLGSGISLLLAWALRESLFATHRRPETPLAVADLPWLAGAVLCGGVLAPVALVWGITGTGAAAGSLLLSSEGVLTALFAALMFREAVGARVAAGAGLLCAAGILLAWNMNGADPASGALSPHALAIVGACALWGLDNNLTRRIAAADPIAIAMIKGLVAGAVNCALSLALGAQLPRAWPLGMTLALGAASYGLSLALYILALRHLGSARTGAHFSTAPFFGASFAVLILGEPVTPNLAAAAALTVVATWLVLTEHHAHWHRHDVLEHSHRHRHDIHHRHEHDGSEGPEPHAHPHVHGALSHSHPHLPDLHHRHDH